MKQTYEFPAIKGFPLVAQWMEVTLREWPGVRSAQCRPATGRLRIEWDDQFLAQKTKLELKQKYQDVYSLLDHFSLREAFQIENGSFKPSDKQYLGNDEVVKWHSVSIQKIRNLLKSHFNVGLSQKEIRSRLVRFGENRIGSIEARSNLEILMNQFNNPATGLLMASVLASLATGGVFEAAVILAVIGVNGGIGYSVESQAEHTLKELAGLGPRQAWVMREGKRQWVAIETIVPGDLLLLEIGSSVVADARLLESDSLMVDESILTGESFPVIKSAKYEVEPDAAISSQPNMVFKGSVVVSGTGRAVVVNTGMNTQAGHIQRLLGHRYHRQTHLQQKLDHLNKNLIDISLISAAGLFGMGLLRGESLLQVIKKCISMAVAAVPEGLPTVSTLTLSRAVSRLMKHHVLIRDLQAVETLGSIQTLCLDKTGTITENKMSVTAIAIPGYGPIITDENLFADSDLLKKRLRSLLACAVLCNDAKNVEQEQSGSPTELALIQFAEKMGISVQTVRALYPRTDVVYRSEYRRYMVTIHGERPYRMMKGNPEEVLNLCDRVKTKGKIRLLTPELQEQVVSQNLAMSKKALRVLGFAYQEAHEEKWIWLGLAGIMDPPRPQMKRVLERFHKAGIRTIMITGDQRITAEALAQQLNLSNGEELVTYDMGDNSPREIALEAMAAKAHVFARVAPEGKKKIVDALRANGQIVAMVGDGINDAPALKAANVGVALGKQGAEVAREVAGVVLLENSIARLLEAVALGRSVNESLKKSVRYLTSTNLSEIGVVLSESAMGLAEVMDPMHLLWINLVTDTFPAIALAMERPRVSILKENPADPNEPFIKSTEYQAVGEETSLFMGLALGSLWYGHRRGLSIQQNQTMVVNVLTFGQALYALSCHSPQRINWGELLRAQRPLVASSLASVVAQLGVLATPLTRRLFNFSSLPPVDVFVSALFAFGGFVVIEAQKKIEC